MADTRLQPLDVPQDFRAAELTISISREAERRRELIRICAATCAGTFIFLKFTTWIISISSVELLAISYVVGFKFLEYIWMNAVIFYSDWVLHHVTDHNMFIIQSVATCSALVWLLFRAWQTLWKPVPELISILGVEVPDSPELSLAGIKSDAITLHWSRPEPQKSVIKYFIQVNGVNVGETSRLETAITVTGLRPGHFYNVRVIAVGPNNFQAGSLVIRLRTYGKNGRPIFSNGRASSSNLASEDHDNDSGDEISNHSHAICVEATALPEDLSTANKDITANNTVTKNAGQRRNTGGTASGRKHSPSIAGSDSVISSMPATIEPKESINYLTEQLEAINREREKVANEMTKEAEDFKTQLSDLCTERDEKKQILKEKEEASEKLKKEVNHAERLNRQAQTRKSQKKKLLKEKLAERSKMEEDMKRWKKEIEDMKQEKGRWRGEKEKIERRKQIKVAELKEEIKLRQAALNTIEEDIRVKGQQIKQLEKHRHSLPGCHDDEKSRLRDENEDREWDITEKAMTIELNNKSQQLREIGTHLHQQQTYLTSLQQRDSIIYHGNSSSINFDLNCDPSKVKSYSTRNKNTQTISPTLHHLTLDSSFITSTSFSNPSPAFAPGPYIDIIDDGTAVPVSDLLDNMTDEDHNLLTAGAPLSPTATSLLPSNIFADDDPLSLHSGSIDLPTLSLQSQMSSYTNNDSNLQSSSHPTSLMSSPQILSHNVPTYCISSRDYTDIDRSLTSPRSSFGPIGSTVSTTQATYKGLRDLFSLPKPKTKDTDQEGLILRSLKSSHSHSFPQNLDEVDSTGSKHRRISFPSGWTGFLHNKTSSTREPLANINSSSPVRNPNVMRFGLGMSVSGLDDPKMHDINPASPRPISVASSDLPRPSTDSAPFGWGPTQDSINNRNSPLSTNWLLYGSEHVSMQQQTTWSCNSSTRKSSSRYGIFPTRVIGDEAEYAPPSDVLASQQGQKSAVGAIGTRPLSIHQIMSPPKLNPAAPAFQGFSFNLNPKYEKGKKISKHGVTEDFDPEDTSMAILNQPDLLLDPSSQQSRDSISIRTQNSCSESYDGLDGQTSETPSELEKFLSSKDKEGSSLQRLFRRGSSGKFSISPFLNKDSGLFGNKKSSYSTVNSDRNESVEREGSIDESSEDNHSKHLELITSSPVLCRNTPGEWMRSKNKDPPNLKERKLSKSWGRFGLRGRKGRETFDADQGEDRLVTEN